MNLKTYIFPITLYLFILLSLANPVLADISVELQASDTTLLLGDEITLQLKVDGTQRNVTVNSPEVSGLSFRQQGPPSASTQTIIINGKVNSFSGLVYTMGVSAKRTGTFDVPGFEVVYEGKTYRTDGFRLVVKEPGQQSKMKVVTETSGPKYYWQEPVTVTLKWLLQEDIEEYEFRFPLLAQKEKIGLKLKEPGKTGVSADITVEGYKVSFIKTQETLEGESFTVYQAEFIIIPPEPGPFKIPAASVKAMVREGTELRRDFFGRVVRAPKLKRIFTAAKPLEISVVPLPTINRPTSFTGAVGRFQINTSIENAQVKVGDPIELSIKVSGVGRYENIEPPLLSENPEFTKNFTINDNLQPGDIRSDGILFKQIIRPRHEDVTAIPALKFSFFNPLLETYQTVESKPILLKVLATGRVKKEDVVTNNNVTAPEIQSFTKEGKGIYANYIFENALTSQTSGWGWILLFIWPPALYIGTLILVKRKLKLQNNVSLVRAKAAKSIGNKRLKKARSLMKTAGDEYYLELSRALGGFIADKLNLGAGEITTIDINQLGKKGLISQGLADQLVEQLDELDRLRFTGQVGSPAERQKLFETISSLMQALGKEIR